MTQQITDIPELKGLCPSCFSQTGGSPVCPVCGYSENSSEDDWGKLRPGTVIHDRYVIGHSLGQGGFGITYLGLDLRLKTKLAIKEYYPSGLAARNTTSMTVMNTSRDTADDFKLGMKKFLDEARTLALFDAHENIVGVRDFFEYNGTAYMVMPFLEGQTLLKYLKEHGDVIPFGEAMKILSPVMDALDVVHSSGLIHRDISPDNVYLTNTGQSKLLDFGAAKSAMALVNQQSHSIVLKKGYSPAEQYQSRGSLGPWTDVYSMAATLYRCITGKVPPDSIDRLMEDTLVPPGRLGFSIPDYTEAALIKALSVSPQARYQSAHDFKNALLGRKAAVNAVAQPQQQPAATVSSEQDVTVRLKSDAPLLQSPAPSSEQDVTVRLKSDAPLLQSPAPSSEQDVTVRLKSSDPLLKSSEMSPPPPLPQEPKKGLPISAIIAAVIAVVIVGGFVFSRGGDSKQSSAPAQSTSSTASSQKETKDVQKVKVIEEAQEEEESEIDQLRKKAEAGDANAQAEYGLLFVKGEKVQLNHTEAAKWFRRSAEQEHIIGKLYWGLMCFYGKGTPQDYAKAAEYLPEPAELGDADAQYALGMMYSNGQGVPKDEAVGYEWLRKAAEQGYEKASNQLKTMSPPYEEDDGGGEVFAQISGTNVNLRKSPSTNSSVIYNFRGGETVTWIEQAEPEPGKYPWHKVFYGDKIGWVYGQFLKF